VVVAAAEAVVAVVVVAVAVAVATGVVLEVETGDSRATISKVGHSRTTSSRVGKVKCFYCKKLLWGAEFSYFKQTSFILFNRVRI
jgi:hypothetical protein